MSDSHYRSLRERLQSKEKRPLDRTREAIAHAPPAPLSITRAHEISALAVGLLVLKHVEETGRTRLHEQAIQDSLKRVTEHLSAAQMMRLEVEAYEIVDWLVGGNGGSQSATFVAEKTESGVRYDPSSSIPDIVREAVAQGFDLKVAYYSGKRMEMNSRVISPKAIAAEVYVRAWCHERKDERIFRMDRIRSAVPIGGVAIRNHYFERVLSEQQAEQQSLELEHLSFSFGNEASYPRPSEASPAARPAPPSTPPWADDATSVAPTRNAPAATDPTSDAKSAPNVEARTPDAGTAPPSAPEVADIEKETEGPRNNAPAAAPSTSKSTSTSTETTNSDSKTAPVLTLSPTPTDQELRAMEFQRRQQEELEAARAADEADVADADNDDQLSFF